MANGGTKHHDPAKTSAKEAKADKKAKKAGKK
jgi:hypothetical protein